MRKLITVCILSFFFTAELVFAWNHIVNPNITEISAFCCDSSETRIIIFKPDAGFWKSEDSGENWAPINTQIFPGADTYYTMCYNLFTIDANCDTIFAKVEFTMEADWEHIYSTDGGTTWSQLRFSNTPRFGWGNYVIVDPGNHDRIMHVDLSSFRISEDFGETWHQTIYNPYIAQPFDFIQSSENDSTLFIASYALSDQYPGGLYRSTNLGQSWEELIYPESLFGLYSIRFENIIELSNQVLLAFPYSGEHTYPFGNTEYLYNYPIRSIDYGDSWSIDTLSTPLIAPVDQVIEMPNQPGVLLFKAQLNGVPNGLYISDNYGESFELLEDVFPDKYVSVYGLFTNHFNYNVYACVAGYGVWKTNDGVSWQQIFTDHNLGKAGYYSISEEKLFSVGNTDNNLMAYDFQTGIWESYPSFSSQIDTLSILSPVFLNDDGTYYSIIHLFGEDREFDFLNVYKSNDNGITWNQSGQRLTGYRNLKDKLPYPYFGEEHSRLIHTVFNDDYRPVGYSVSTDTGATWSDYYNWTDFNCAHTDTTLYFIVSSEGVFKSYDDGASWIDLDYPQNVNWDSYQVIHFNEANHTLYTFMEDSVYCYDGNSWESISPLFMYPRTVAMVPGETPKFFYTNLTKNIIASLDGGYSWFSLQLDIPYDEQLPGFYMVKYDPWRDRIWVMTGLGPMYVQVEDVSGVSDEPVQLYPADYELLTAYPNPFNESSRVVFNLMERGEVKLELFDIMGRIVTTLAEGEYQSGKHEVFLDASGLASGTYILKLNTSYGSRAHKVTLVK